MTTITPEDGPYGLRVDDRVHVTPLNRWGRIVGFHGPQVRVLLDRPVASPPDYRIFDPAELVLASGQ
jgi:hypothetical protein